MESFLRSLSGENLCLDFYLLRILIKIFIWREFVYRLVSGENFYQDFYLTRIFIKIFIWWEFSLRLTSGKTFKFWLWSLIFVAAIRLLTTEIPTKSYFDKYSWRLYHKVRLFSLRLGDFLWTWSGLFFDGNIWNEIYWLILLWGCGGLILKTWNFWDDIVLDCSSFVGAIICLLSKLECLIRGISFQFPLKTFYSSLL